MSRQVVSLVAALCLVVFVVGCSTEAEIERATAGATAATETPDDDVTLVPHEEDDPELSAEDDLEPDPSPPDADADADAESQALEPPAEAAPLPLEAEENPATLAPPELAEGEFPPQPMLFSDYAEAVLRWVQGKTSLDEIAELFTVWDLAPVFGGERVSLVDPDLDGRPSVVVVLTPPGPSRFGFGNLAIYDPVEGSPGRYRLAYDRAGDLGLMYEGLFSGAVALRSVEDLTGDGAPDITFTDAIAGAHTSHTQIHVLVRYGDGYRDLPFATGFELAADDTVASTIPPLNIPTAHDIDATADLTGDDLPDIAVVGGTFGSVGAEPQREFRWVFSAAGGQLTRVSREGLPTDWAVWALLDANEAFDEGDWDRAIVLYNRVLNDASLREFDREADDGTIPQGFQPDGVLRLRESAHLRKSLASASLGDLDGARAAAQALADGSGYFAEAGAQLHLAFTQETDLASACLAFNRALDLAGGEEWEGFWNYNYGYQVPRLRAADLCPF